MCNLVRVSMPILNNPSGLMAFDLSDIMNDGVHSREVCILSVHILDHFLTISFQYDLIKFLFFTLKHSLLKCHNLNDHRMTEHWFASTIGKLDNTLRISDNHSQSS